jgi:hypothetical protein
VSVFGYDLATGTPRRLAVDEDGGLITTGFGAKDDLTITDTTVGSVETIVITNGTITKTVTINDSTGGITIVWS